MCLWLSLSYSVLHLLWGHVLFLFQFHSILIVKCEKLPRVWNRLMHGAGVSRVGLFWSYTSNYSITLIDFLSGWLFHKKTWVNESVLTGGMQRAGCRTVVFRQQNKGSVWLYFLNWREPLKKNNNYYDMTLKASLWPTIPLKTIIKLTCVGPNRLTLARNKLRSSINH